MSSTRPVTASPCPSTSPRCEGHGRAKGNRRPGRLLGPARGHRLLCRGGPTTSSSTAYNVQLAFTSNPATLRDGIQAAVTITTAQAVNALAVPTSAVNHLGSLSYVLVPNWQHHQNATHHRRLSGCHLYPGHRGLTAGHESSWLTPTRPYPPAPSPAGSPRITGGASGTTGPARVARPAPAGLGQVADESVGRVPPIYPAARAVRLAPTTALSA